jgi:hypothetical protein
MWNIAYVAGGLLPGVVSYVVGGQPVISRVQQVVSLHAHDQLSCTTSPQSKLNEYKVCEKICMGVSCLVWQFIRWNGSGPKVWL